MNERKRRNITPYDSVMSVVGDVWVDSDFSVYMVVTGVSSWTRRRRVELPADADLVLSVHVCLNRDRRQRSAGRRATGTAWRLSTNTTSSTQPFCHDYSAMQLLILIHGLAARRRLRQLHWLPVRQSIFNKTSVSTVNTTGVPAYLKEHLVQSVPSRQTRSSCITATVCPETDHLFRKTVILLRHTAPVIWNSLPTEVILCDSEYSFKRHLKTFLYNSCHQTV